MTLRELFEVFWSITEVSVTAREPGSMQFIHKWEYSEGITDRETIHQYHDRMDGKLTLVDVKINAHGDPARGGSEIGWGVKEKLFPKEMLDAPITHMNVHSRHSGTSSVSVDIELARLTAMTLIPEGNEDERSNNQRH